MMKRYPQLGSAKVLDGLSFAYDNPELMSADLERETELVENKQRPQRPPPNQLTLPFSGTAATASSPYAAPTDVEPEA